MQLELVVQLNPDLRKVRSLLASSWPKELGHFEKVRILDMQNRSGHKS